MRVALLWLAALACGLLMSATALASSCSAPANASSVELPGRPFGLAVTRDGCWMFVSMATGHGRGAVAVLRNSGGAYSVERVVKFAGEGTGDALTHDGKLLIVTEGKAVEVFEVSELQQAAGAALAGTLHDGRDAAAVYAITSLDDGLLFVSDEYARRISVYNLAKWRLADFKGNPLIGHIPTAIAPVGLALSPDGKWLYSTSEVAPPRWGFSRSCEPEVRSERRHSQGYLIRIDIAKAAKDPSRSLAGGVQAGCNPVRVAVSPDGAYLWVTARDSDALLRIAAPDLGSKARNVNVASFHVGVSPVGVAVRPDGNQVWVALSNRFASAKRDSTGRELVGLLGTSNPKAASLKMVSEPASGFPRELAFLPDGRTLAVGSFAAKRIEFLTTPP